VSRAPLRVAVVGARRVRQGTGEWVARELQRLGCTVEAIVGTSPATLEDARVGLRARHGIEARGYLSLDELLAEEAVDAVAVCSPPEAHLAQVEACVAAGKHVLCEKPLWWSAGLEHEPLAQAREQVAARARALTGACERAGLALVLNAQWPYTLDAYYELHPEARREPLERFAMHMGPTRTGPAMVVDSGSHVISMLQALAGPGAVRDVQADVGEGGRRVALSFGYAHAAGTTAAELVLTWWPSPPRPAGYAINGRAVERRIEPGSYAFTFAAGARTVPVRDPLAASVEAFVEAARSRRSPDPRSVVGGMVDLLELVAAVRAAGAEA
jgi:predicted dehydrogenase